MEISSPSWLTTLEENEREHLIRGRDDGMELPSTWRTELADAKRMLDEKRTRELLDKQRREEKRLEAQRIEEALNRDEQRRLEESLDCDDDARRKGSVVSDRTPELPEILDDRIMHTNQPSCAMEDQSTSATRDAGDRLAPVKTYLASVAAPDARILCDLDTGGFTFVEHKIEPQAMMDLQTVPTPEDSEEREALCEGLVEDPEGTSVCKGPPEQSEGAQAQKRERDGGEGLDEKPGAQGGIEGLQGGTDPLPEDSGVTEVQWQAAPGSPLDSPQKTKTMLLLSGAVVTYRGPSSPRDPKQTTREGADELRRTKRDARAPACLDAPRGTPTSPSGALEGAMCATRTATAIAPRQLFGRGPPESAADARATVEAEDAAETLPAADAQVSASTAATAGASSEPRPMDPEYCTKASDRPTAQQLLYLRRISPEYVEPIWEPKPFTLPPSDPPAVPPPQELELESDANRPLRSAKYSISEAKEVLRYKPGAGYIKVSYRHADSSSEDDGEDQPLVDERLRDRASKAFAAPPTPPAATDAFTEAPGPNQTEDPPPPFEYPNQTEDPPPPFKYHGQLPDIDFRRRESMLQHFRRKLTTDWILMRWPSLRTRTRALMREKPDFIALAIFGLLGFLILITPIGHRLVSCWRCA
ncbi:hypothetical protein CYMTET_6835 [Cymbomonas tetramitiformis]|uniref:Uncharacterized protein n=1 Tax=Cymbomonas tetramitiformis TaxID=36881 RepID=A0AAE0GWE7_9CHLO|nr:hypothetical protein CYMTET_6835 [Cymbomonas tetramitiformis]